MKQIRSLKKVLANHSHDYTPFLVKDGLKGKRIGIEKSHLEVNPDMAAILAFSHDRYGTSREPRWWKWM